MNSRDFGVIEDEFEAANAGTLDLDYLGDWSPKTLDPSVDPEFRGRLERARKEPEGP